MAATAGVIADAADGEAGTSGAFEATSVAETGTTPLGEDWAALPLSDIDAPEVLEAEEASEDKPARYEHPDMGRIAIVENKNPALSARCNFFPDMTPPMILTPKQSRRLNSACSHKLAVVRRLCALIHAQVMRRTRYGHARLDYTGTSACPEVRLRLTIGSLTPNGSVRP